MLIARDHASRRPLIGGTYHGMTIRLRRHHVLCAVGFYGQGHDSAYLSNISHLVDGALRKHDGRSVTIRITDHADVICAPCPFRRGAGCESQTVIDRMDERHGQALDLSPGDILTWGACLDRVRDRVRPDDLTSLCEGCSWLDGGLCRAAVARLSVEEEGLPEGSPTTRGRADPSLAAQPRARSQERPPDASSPAMTALTTSPITNGVMKATASGPTARSAPQTGTPSAPATPIGQARPGR